MSEEKPSPLAIAAVVLSVLSCFPCCGGCFTGIAGTVCGKMELGKIANGDSSPAGETLAKVGFILGLVNVGWWTLVAIGYALMMIMGMGGAAMM